MRILLIDADSKIPNIALMKLSTYHKNLGDMVDFIRLDGKVFEYKDTHDIAYSSIIFTKNKDNIKGNVTLGGTGISLETELPEEAEHLFPDYSLYPDNQYSIGYLTRGCCRDCSFCVVPKKEGLIQLYAYPNEFVDKKLPLVRILDNNLLAYHGWKDLLKEIKEINKPIKFENFDFKLLTEEMILELFKIRKDSRLNFALDNPKDIPLYEKKMWLIDKYFRPWTAKFYILSAFDTTLEEDIKRIKFCMEHKILPYLIRHEKYLNGEHVDFFNALASWCNQPNMVKTKTFEQFMNIKFKQGHPRIKQHVELFNYLWNKI